MNTLLICVCFFIGSIVQALHLTTPQITSIRNLIQHPKMTPRHRTTLNTVLYKAYEKWAISKAVQFKSLHKNKCKNIDICELIFASKIGLFKSIQKYNGKSDLTYFSNIFVKSELLLVVTDTYSMSILPKRIRCKNKSGFSKTDSKLYKHLLTVQPFSVYEPWKIELMGALSDDYVDQSIDKYETTETIHTYLEKQPLFIKRLFLLYMNHFSKTNREPSRKYLAEMMCCSDETIRQKMQ